MTSQWNIRPGFTAINPIFDDRDTMEKDEERVSVSQQELDHLSFPHMLDYVVNVSLPSVTHQNLV
jgi:hypothetical protein